MGKLGRYWEYSRSPFYSYLFVLPLLFFYEFLAQVVNRGQMVQVRNAADVFVKALLSLLGVHGLFYAAVVLAAVAGIFIFYYDAKHRDQGIRLDYLVLMFGESIIYACLFGGIVSRIVILLFPLAQPLGFDFSVSFMVALGAGIYEELVFRVLLMGGLIWMGKQGFKLGPVAAVLFGVIASALLFALFHYLGPLGDSFTWHSFLFRFVAGIVLAGLYAVRGFGITVYTHTLYDVLLTLQGLR
ncbi:MAG TPA: CPBP family intramembrane metalloprotease [Armatimonadetes bacterium]|nr:CPBP family intramembrane metalloprotease [Armatimonadota bacterium]